MLGPRPSNESYTSPLHCCTQTRQSFLFYRMISQVLVFLLTVGPCVTTVLTNINWSTLRMHVESTLLINATGNYIYICILNHWYLSNWVVKGETGLIILVALRLSDVVHKNSIPKMDQGKLTRAHALTHLTRMPSNTRNLLK